MVRRRASTRATKSGVFLLFGQPLQVAALVLYASLKVRVFDPAADYAQPGTATAISDGFANRAERGIRVLGNETNCCVPLIFVLDAITRLAGGAELAGNELHQFNRRFPTEPLCTANQTLGGPAIDDCIAVPARLCVLLSHDPA